MAKVVQLKDIATIITGNTPKTADAENYNSNDICFIKPSDISESEIDELSESEFYISEKARGTARLAPKGSILVTCIGIIGKTAILKRECAFNQQINAVIPDSNLVDTHYLAYAIANNKDHMQEAANAAVVPIISKSEFSKVSTILPSLKEQQRIANVLGKITAVISLRKQQLTKLDELVKARFVEMFGDPVTNPKGWPMHQLSEYISFLTSGSRGWSQYFSDSGEMFITIKNVKNCQITLNDVQYVRPPQNAEAIRTKVQEGDLLISITADLGRTGVVTKEIANYGAYINQHLTCIRLDRTVLNPLYVAHFMESPAGKQQFIAKNQSAVKAGLNFNSINTLAIMVPPIKQQENFVVYCQKVTEQKLTIQQGLARLEMLKRTLMQEYFGGGVK